MSTEFNPSLVEKGECGCIHPSQEDVLHLENDLDFFLNETLAMLTKF